MMANGLLCCMCEVLEERGILWEYHIKSAAHYFVTLAVTLNWRLARDDGGGGHICHSPKISAAAAIIFIPHTRNRRRAAKEAHSFPSVRKLITAKERALNFNGAT
jgi:hypothetical protein